MVFCVDERTAIRCWHGDIDTAQSRIRTHGSIEACKSLVLLELTLDPMATGRGAVRVEHARDFHHLCIAGPLVAMARMSG